MYEQTWITERAPLTHHPTEGCITMELDYTVKSSKSFDEAVDAVTAAVPDLGFKVQHVHDLAAALQKKGHAREPLKIIEICNADHAAAVLEKNVKIALMLPCPIVVYEEDGEVFVSTLRASVMADFYPEAEIGDVSEQVEEALVSAVNAGR